MCPYCGQFENTNAAQLSTLADAGTITVRLHPLSFLDGLSVNTEYSTRENAVGLTNTKLVSLAA